MKKPEIKVVPTIINIFINKMRLIFSKSDFSELMYLSTAVNEFPIKRGATNEKIRAIIVIINPKNNFVLYL